MLFKHWFKYIEQSFYRGNVYTEFKCLKIIALNYGNKDKLIY